ncbi:glycerol-3-phosphate dehydrogenase/oxidase [Sinomonas sp. G460-2]|uniref:glycerol-3-phosphate dehydrogenase/oxidase n=1 Tax=Sinomonas sp. G460-2 TaxID=3393464 RepID=UPI0039EEC363
MSETNRLSVAQRRESIDGMRREELDVLVVGGGITGAGAALDAALRGLTVGLIEQTDLAAGTSSRSSKLIHGGLRYLAQFNFRLVREALRERSLLLQRIAPHLVTPVPFVLPLRHRVWERLYVGAGIALYDRLGGARHIPAGRHLSRRGVARVASALRTSGYVGGVLFHDVQTDDARYTITVARTARAHGALIATRIRADHVAIEDGRAIGVQCTDLETGEGIAIRARHTVTAAGAWTGSLVPSGSLTRPELRLSKGVHIVLPKSAIDMDTGLLARTATGLLFVIPWQGSWLVGDTDTEWQGADPACAAADRADVAVLLGRLNSVLNTPVSAADILGVFVGLRPLVAGEPDVDTFRLSREHAIISPVPGMSMITGGKFTTYRAMAAQLIDTAATALGDPAIPASTTDRTPLLGAEGFDAPRSAKGVRADEQALGLTQAERLSRRYGSCIAELLDLIEDHPQLREEIPGGAGTLAAEIVHACTHEGALHLDDVLERRTRIAIQTADRGRDALPRIAALMKDTLGWSDAEADRERHRYEQIARHDQWIPRQPCSGPQAHR